jgi:hypothetical protein
MLLELIVGRKVDLACQLASTVDHGCRSCTQLEFEANSLHKPERGYGFTLVRGGNLMLGSFCQYFVSGATSGKV